MNSYSLKKNKTPHSTTRQMVKRSKKREGETLQMTQFRDLPISVSRYGERTENQIKCKTTGQEHITG